ncbi:hypothetical protein ANCDUO_15940 [Ancylostoma duodenale]|uniref:Uncharacterized protein n=1 Tax=Ancylostoma duodenale TaxID=51022 RepID=A0A0C2CVN4_9BILA|nr:hypothetical protein ANCDUO_15940 [Ancylostoma duodenale]
MPYIQENVGHWCSRCHAPRIRPQTATSQDTISNRIFKRDTHRGAPIRSPEYDESERQKAMDAYDWRKEGDPTENYEELAKALIFCAKQL